MRSDPAFWISLVAVVVAGLSLFRATRADRRNGAAELSAKVLRVESVAQAWGGTTTIEIVNLGPSVAEKVQVAIVESDEVADERDRNPRHVTEVADRMVASQSRSVEAVGIVSENEISESIEIRWRDATGKRTLTPDPPTSLSAEWI